MQIQWLGWPAHFQKDCLQHLRSTHRVTPWVHLLGVQWPRYLDSVSNSIGRVETVVYAPEPMLLEFPNQLYYALANLLHALQDGHLLVISTVAQSISIISMKDYEVFKRTCYCHCRNSVSDLSNNHDILVYSLSWVPVTSWVPVQVSSLQVWL